MTDRSRTAHDVDQYLTATLGLHDEGLNAALRASDEGGLPAIAVSAPLGMLLHVLARAIGARRILEIGTLGGYSAIWLARALPADGRLVTLELDAHHAEVARANLERAGLTSVSEVVVGPAGESLQRMATEGAEPFDLVFIDADKEGYPAYLEGVMRLAHPGTLIVADNVVRGGQIADQGNTDSRVLGVRTFIELLAADPRVSATVIQTVGAKGYDGVAVAVVLPPTRCAGRWGAAAAPCSGAPGARRGHQPAAAGRAGRWPARGHRRAPRTGQSGHAGQRARVIRPRPG